MIEFEDAIKPTITIVPYLGNQVLLAWQFLDLDFCKWGQCFVVLFSSPITRFIRVLVWITNNELMF